MVLYRAGNRTRGLRLGGARMQRVYLGSQLIHTAARDVILSTALPETLAYIAAVEGVDGDNQQLETGVLGPMVKFANWRIPLGGACCLMAGARTLEGALVPMVGPTPVATNFISDDYNRLQGLAGVNNGGKFISTDYAIDTARQDDHHAAIRLSIPPVAAFRAYMSDGAANAAGATGLFGLNPGTDCRVYSALSGGAVSVAGFMSVVGLKGVSRNSSAEYVYTDGAAETTFVRASGTPPGLVMAVFDFTGGSNSSDAGISMYSVGPFIDMTTFRLMSNALSADLTTALA